MSEAEVLEAVADYVANAHASFTLYVSFVFGFLVVAYLAGKELSRFQAWVASSTFALAASASALSMTANLQAFGLIMRTYPTTLNNLPLYDGDLWVVLMSTVLWPGILVSLYFMWDVRR